MTAVANPEMTAQEALGVLAVEYGVEATALPGRIRLLRGDGAPPPLESLPVCRVVRTRQRDPDLIAELRTWDEDRERCRGLAAFRWASRETPAGCWGWCFVHRSGLRDVLDAAFDAIDGALRKRDPYTLSLALLRFRGVILDAIAAFCEASPTDPVRADREHAVTLQGAR